MNIGMLLVKSHIENSDKRRKISKKSVTKWLFFFFVVSLYMMTVHESKAIDFKRGNPLTNWIE